jgi:hypothetical protein
MKKNHKSSCKYPPKKSSIVIWLSSYRPGANAIKLLSVIYELRPELTSDQYYKTFLGVIYTPSGIFPMILTEGTQGTQIASYLCWKKFYNIGHSVKHISGALLLCRWFLKGCPLTNTQAYFYSTRHFYKIDARLLKKEIAVVFLQLAVHISKIRKRTRP